MTLSNKVRYQTLLDKTPTIPCFKHEGKYYLGDREEAIADFIKSEPFPADFGVWLQDNLNELKSVNDI